jgi:ATP-dependent Zn protease
VREIVNCAFVRALEQLERHRPVLEAGAEKLLQQETLDQTDLKMLQSGLPIAAATSVAHSRHSLR